MTGTEACLVAVAGLLCQLPSVVHFLRPTLAHRTVLLAVVLLLAFGAGVRASEYPGWGDTGWIYASKRDCCNEAIGIASQYSEQACLNTGGRPSSFEGEGQRGSCSPQFTQDDDGNVLYRCSGQAAVWCDQ